MGRFSNVDPNFSQEQSRFFQLKALKMAKNSSAISSKKALLLVVPIFVVGIALLLFLGGAFDKGYTIRYDDAIYKIADTTVNELPEGYEQAGVLVYAEDPKKSTKNLASDWTLDAELYVNPAYPKKAYISAFGVYLEVHRK